MTVATPLLIDLTGHVAIVTGANHGIGAATAQELAISGAAVLVTYLALEDEQDPGTPDTARAQRAVHPDSLVAAIRSAGGAAHAVEADLSDPAVPTDTAALALREALSGWFGTPLRTPTT